MSEQYTEAFYIVPTYIRKLPGMTLGYMDVYAIIFQFWNKGKQCFLKNDALVARTGFKLRYIQEALSYFEQHNELKRVQIGNKRYLIKPEAIIEVEPENEQPVDKNSRGAPQCIEGCTTVHSRGALQCTQNPKTTPAQAALGKARSKLSTSLNKESLNKELNNDHKGMTVKKRRAKNEQRELTHDQAYMLERLVSMGVYKWLALNIIHENELSEILRVIEAGREKKVKSEKMGAYINMSFNKTD